MAVIDSKKLLPSGKPGGSIIGSQKPFLVPVKNITVKKSAVISQKLLKPADKEEPSTRKEGNKNIIEIKKKVISIKDILKNTFLIKRRAERKKRIEDEKERREKREKKLEKKPDKNQKDGVLKGRLPGGSILDTIGRFLTFTLAGFLLNKYAEYLPKLKEFGKFIKPAAKFLEETVKFLFEGFVFFVDKAYERYDKIEKKIEEIGGKDAKEKFQEFSKNLNAVLNGAIIAATVALAASKPGGSGVKAIKEAYSKGFKDGFRKGLAAGGAAGAGLRGLPQGVRAGSTTGRAIAKQTRIATRASEKATRYAAAAQIRQAAKESAKAGAKQATKFGLRTAVKTLKPLFSRIPIIGGLIEFGLSWALGDPVGKAAFRGVGSVLVGAIGGAIGSVIPGPGTLVGMALGGFAGAELAGALYDMIFGNKKPPQPKAEGQAEGGRVSGGQSTVAKSRRIRVRKQKRLKSIQPQKTMPGKNISGGLDAIEKIYGKEDKKKMSPLRALKYSSKELKDMKAFGGFPGAMFGAGIDMALGQKPDKNLSEYLGNAFGVAIQSVVDSEIESSFLDITKTLGLANGGVVPSSRQIRTNQSIGERVRKKMTDILTPAIEHVATKVFNRLNKELMLKKPYVPSEGDGTGAAEDAGGTAGGEYGGYAPTGRQKEIYDYLVNVKKLSDVQALGLMANIMRESSFRTDPGLGGAGEIGMFQWNPQVGRAQKMEKAVPDWRTNWKGQIDYALTEYTGPQYLSTKFSSAQEAADWWMREWEKPTDKIGASKKHAEYLKTVPRAPDGSAKFRERQVQMGSLTGVSLIETSQYGYRWGRMHNGIDLQNKAGWQQTTHLPVTIKKGGVVEYAGIAGDGNGIVIIRHEDGSVTRYIHLNQFKVKAGQEVKPGTIIGRIAGEGEPGYGNSTGPHLHFEYRDPSGKPINPKNIYNNYVALGGKLEPSLTPLHLPIEESIGQGLPEALKKSIQSKPKPTIGQGLPDALRQVVQQPTGTPKPKPTQPKSTPKGESYLVNGKMYYVDFENNTIKDAQGNDIDFSRGKNKWLLKAISEQRNAPKFKPPTLGGQLHSSLQNYPSYAQGGMRVIRDVNNIVMPIEIG